MDYITGQTITEIFLSTDAYNNPVVPANFTAATIQDGFEIDSEEIDFIISVVDANLGIYKFTFIPNIAGVYQIYINNLTANVIYTSDIYPVTNYSSTIYVGL